MNTSTRAALGSLMLLLGSASAFAQGVFETPPPPNSSQSMPQSPNSAPPGARTLSADSTDMQRHGTLATTRVEPEPTLMTKPGAPAIR